VKLEDRYQSLFEKAPLGFFVADRQGNIEATNSTLRSLFSLEKKKKPNLLTERHLANAGFATQFRLCISRAEPVIAEADFRIKTGYRYCVQYFLTPFFDRGRVVGVQGVVINQTARMEALEEFQRIHDYNSRLLSSLSPVVSVGPDLRIRFANDSFAQWAGISSEKLMNRLLVPVLKLKGEERDAFAANVREAGKSHKTRKGLQFRAGKSTFGYSLFPFEKDSTGIIMRDISREKELEIRIQKLNGRLIELQEEERQRIAGDLHDSVGQLILAAKLNLVSYKSDPTHFADRFDVALSIIDQASQELREIYTNLYPRSLHDLGLEATVRWHARNILETHGLKVSLEMKAGTLSHELQVRIFRITQEVFANIVKHAHARSVKLKLSRNKTRIQLTISDDGKGFSPSAPRSGFGLDSIRRRVESVGGEFSIESSRGHGSKFSVTLPQGEAHE